MKKPTLKTILKEAGKLLLALIPAAVATALHIISGRSKAFSEWFAQHIQPLWAGSMGRLCSLIPWSVNELALYILIPLAIVALIINIVRTYRRQHKHPNWFLRWLRCVFLIAGGLWLAANLGNGVNYNRMTFAEKSGLGTAGGTKEELARVVEELVREVNLASEKVERDGNGLCVMPEDYLETSRRVMKELGGTYDFLDVYYPRPKGVIWSTFLSECNITGVFSPFTVECQINTDITPYNLPHTVCHELAHAAGFEREDEANFIGFLGCILSDEPEFVYSGYMLGYIYASNALWGADYDRWLELSGQLCPEVCDDLSANTQYWSRFKSKVAEVSEKVNDATLKFNNQTDGVKSYGRVVDLMLSYYQKKSGDEP